MRRIPLRRGRIARPWLIVLVSLVLIGGLAAELWRMSRPPQSAEKGRELVLLCAAGPSKAVQEIGADYERECGVKVRIAAIDSSGRLLSQLRTAPNCADLYLASDESFARDAQGQKLVVEVMPVVGPARRGRGGQGKSPQDPCLGRSAERRRAGGAPQCQGHGRGGERGAGLAGHRPLAGPVGAAERGRQPRLLGGHRDRSGPGGEDRRGRCNLRLGRHGPAVRDRGRGTAGTPVADPRTSGGGGRGGLVAAHGGPAIRPLPDGPRPGRKGLPQGLLRAAGRGRRLGSAATAGAHGRGHAQAGHRRRGEVVQRGKASRSPRFMRAAASTWHR